MTNLSTDYCKHCLELDQIAEQQMAISSRMSEQSTIPEHAFQSTFDRLISSNQSGLQTESMPEEMKALGEEQGKRLHWAALLILVVIIPTVGGNTLVIMAVSLEKKLQYATNYFLMSLAVADLLVGLFVMPIALLTIMFGIAIPVPIKGLETNALNTNNITCELTKERFGNFMLFGSLAAFFTPLAIMIVTYFLTIQTLQRKACMAKSKPPQRLTWLTVSTVFQTEETPCSSPEKVAMLDCSGKDKTLPNSNDETLMRRMSSVGRKSAQTISNEQRASKVLGIVFSLFLLMWCPFFITNITLAMCDSCNQTTLKKLLEIFVWIGYVSSGVNPLVYTLFNKTFRSAFGRYITCNYRATKSVRTLRKCSSKIYFRNPRAENSKFFMKCGIRNGISPATHQSPVRLRNSTIQSSSTILLDTLLLTENEGDKTEDQVSYV
ncbi:5-hydroxytryptamine receptor 2B isoform X2 [Perognathus longimembris pacificus]|uniref:5-hydroxytryptamine receptor 2B isoform X2 n=1 Tax=Perognathus longimembris pacificus TaxID=214514 RepID=UPI0020187851|nr:5-hydroxytryptamine receptor 2B isoform X2 [Perognathus longimembris pacificus]